MYPKSYTHLESKLGKSYLLLKKKKLFSQIVIELSLDEVMIIVMGSLDDIFW